MADYGEGHSESVKHRPFPQRCEHICGKDVIRYDQVMVLPNYLLTGDHQKLNYFVFYLSECTAELFLLLLFQLSLYLMRFVMDEQFTSVAGGGAWLLLAVLGQALGGLTPSTPNPTC